MTGELTIDNVDVYTTYGAYLAFEGIAPLVAFPSTKPVRTVSWQESDGVEADLSHLSLASREITLNFAMKGSNSAIQTFYYWLGAKPYRTWNVVLAGVSLSLRLVRMTSLESALDLHSLGVTLSHDTSPLAGYTYASPITTKDYPDEYYLNGKSLADYGVCITRGSADAAVMPGQVKPLMTRDISTLDGLIYDSSALSNTYEGADFSLGFVMAAATTNEFWRNWRALLYDLVAEKTAQYTTDRCRRTLTGEYIPQTIYCYYKGSSANGCHIDGRGIWVEGSLTFGRLSR